MKAAVLNAFGGTCGHCGSCHEDLKHGVIALNVITSF